MRATITLPFRTFILPHYTAHMARRRTLDRRRLNTSAGPPSDVVHQGQPNQSSKRSRSRWQGTTRPLSGVSLALAVVIVLLWRGSLLPLALGAMALGGVLLLAVVCVVFIAQRLRLRGQHKA